MDDHDTAIVKGLKDPWKFLFIDMDLAIAASLVGFIALSSGAPPTIAVGIAIAFGYGLHTLRKGKPRGYAMHLAYWFLPPAVSRLNRAPPVWAERTVG